MAYLSSGQLVGAIYKGITTCDEELYRKNGRNI